MGRTKSQDEAKGLSLPLEKYTTVTDLPNEQRLSSVLAIIAIGFLAAVTIIATQLRSVRTDGTTALLASHGQLSVLSLAQTLVNDDVPSRLAMTTASALSILQNLCSQPPSALPGSVSSYAAVKRNREK